MCFSYLYGIVMPTAVSSQTAVSGGSDRENRPEGMGKCKKIFALFDKKAVSRPISGSLLTVLLSGHITVSHQ